MKFLRSSARERPQLSLVLLDWSVRESFHLLSYLDQQTISRDQFEVIVIEYYDRVSPALRPYEQMVDSWVLLEMPKRCYYHKHLMYNVGIAVAKGEIVVICDSDAMAKPTFLQSILEAFAQESSIVLHLDQFRNSLKRYYPFNWPTFEQVTGEGAINAVGSQTTGLVARDDLFHRRNYGACFCARRSDLIKIGGADEHIDYAGHICGPYEMTLRLLNAGLRVVWHSTEFLYHTWHPGTDGIDNYNGPQDGRGVSTTAIDLVRTGQIEPHVSNRAIRSLGQKIGVQGASEVLPLLVSKEIVQETDRSFLKNTAAVKAVARRTYRLFVRGGRVYEMRDGKAVGIRLGEEGITCRFKVTKIIFRFLRQVIKEMMDWVYTVGSYFFRRIKQVVKFILFLLQGKYRTSSVIQIFLTYLQLEVSLPGIRNVLSRRGAAIGIGALSVERNYRRVLAVLGEDHRIVWSRIPVEPHEVEQFLSMVESTGQLFVHPNEYVETVSMLPRELREKIKIFSL